MLSLIGWNGRPEINFLTIYFVFGEGWKFVPFFRSDATNEKSCKKLKLPLQLLTESVDRGCVPAIFIFISEPKGLDQLVRV